MRGINHGTGNPRRRSQMRGSRVIPDVTAAMPQERNCFPQGFAIRISEKNTAVPFNQANGLASFGVASRINRDERKLFFQTGNQFGIPFQRPKACLFIFNHGWDDENIYAGVFIVGGFSVVFFVGWEYAFINGILRR